MTRGTNPQKHTREFRQTLKIILTDEIAVVTKALLGETTGIITTGNTTSIIPTHYKLYNVCNIYIELKQNDGFLWQTKQFQNIILMSKNSTYCQQ